MLFEENEESHNETPFALRIVQRSKSAFHIYALTENASSRITLRADYNLWVSRYERK